MDHFTRIIGFNKGDAITFWRHNNHTFHEVLEEFKTIGFETLNAVTSLDKENIMVISKLKSHS